MIEFFMPMIPPQTTHQTKQVTCRNGKPIFYESADLKAARSKLMGHLAKHAPKEKYTGPVRLVAKWLFPIPKSRKNVYKNGQYKATSPDNGNANKLLEDCMENLGYFNNDAQIASLIIEHFWADTPGIYIKIEKV